MVQSRTADTGERHGGYSSHCFSASVPVSSSSRMGVSVPSKEKPNRSRPRHGSFPERRALRPFALSRPQPRGHSSHTSSSHLACQLYYLYYSVAIVSQSAGILHRLEVYGMSTDSTQHRSGRDGQAEAAHGNPLRRFLWLWPRLGAWLPASPWPCKLAGAEAEAAAVATQAA